MMNHSSFDSNRWEELQAAQLLFGLTASEQAEFDDLARRMTADQADSFDMVVASLDVAWSNMQSEPLPEHLRNAIRSQAEQLLATKPNVSLANRSTNSEAANRTSNYVPWLLSAACLSFAFLSWFANQPGSKPVLSLAQRRAELMASNVGLVQANWTDGPTPITNATGDIVWSASKQEGFMRFRGLPVNSPTKEQYQLWIFDKNQSDKTPIDGGVFDITTADDEAIIPINAKLHVTEPFLFAITIEKPGGVVVSSRERLPLLAKLE
jgi:hypothetical protein